MTADDDTIELVSGFGVMRRATFQFTNQEQPLGDVTLEVAYDSKSRRLAVESVKVSRRVDGPEVTGLMLRSVRVQEYLRFAASQMAVIFEADGDWVQAEMYLSVPENFKSEDAESMAARIYAFAHLTNEPPLKTISEYLKVSQSTATRLVARARARGLLN